MLVTMKAVQCALVVCALVGVNAQIKQPKFKIPRPGYAAVPQIPNQFYAEITSNTTGTLQGIPYGVTTVRQYYDYDNQRKRFDFSDGTSKMYDYKTLVDPGMEKNPKFPSPQGFKFDTNNINNTCCWLWLIDDESGFPEKMDQFRVESNAKDMGPTPEGEHWSSVTKFPFLQTDDWWFKDDVISIQNSYFNIPGTSSISGWVMSNSTWANVKYGPIDESVFAHPDSRPTFGKCKQCGVDSECPMWLCMQ